MTDSYLKEISPLEAFVEYVNETKPYHSKIIEVHEEYVHDEGITIAMEEEHWFGDPRCEVWINEDEPRCEYRGIEIEHPQKPITIDPCLSGYSVRPYGSPDVVPVMSPNQSKTFIEYPAIDPSKNEFIVPGDLELEFKPGNQITLTTVVENFCDANRVTGVRVDNSNSDYRYYFQIKGDNTSRYTEGFVFYADGISYRKKYLVVADSTFDVNTNTTEIEVYPSISDSDKENIRYIGILVTKTVDVNNKLVNNGTYTIESATYTGGNLAEWPDRTDRNTYIQGDDGHTVVRVVESLYPLPILANCENILSGVTFHIKPFESALHYSNHRRKYYIDPALPGIQGFPKIDGIAKEIFLDVWGRSKTVPFGVSQNDDGDDDLVNRIDQAPNEGTFCSKMLAATPSSFDNTGTVIPGSGSFTCSGSLGASNIFTGDTFSVQNSDNHVGTYTIAAIEYSEETQNAQTTTLFVNEIVRNDEVDIPDVLPNEDCRTMSCQLTADDCPDILRFEIPANVIIVDGDHTDRFVQGKQFVIDSGSLMGEYVTHSSRFINGKTHIRTTSTLIDRRNGFDLTEIRGGTGNLYGFMVPEDLTNLFEEDDYFNVIDAKNNDGFYQVVSPGSIYHQDINATEIPVEVNVQLDFIAGGKVVPFREGNLTEKLFGYSEYEEWCNNIPYTYMKVAFDEIVKFIGSGMEIEETLILHNMENTDSLGYELPLSTVFADSDGSPISGPDVVEVSNVEPAGSPMLPFWFDTRPEIESNRRLKRYVEGGSPEVWEPTNTNNTIWWVRTETNPDTQIIYHKELYYKKISFENVDGSGLPVYNESDWIMDLPRSPQYPVSPGKNLLYPARGNLKPMAIGSFIAPLQQDGRAQYIYEIEDYLIGKDIYNETENVPDMRLVNIWVNSIPAAFEFSEYTEEEPGLFRVTIEILLPFVTLGDNVYYEIFERLDDGDELSWQHNAHLYTFDQTPNNFFYNQVNVIKSTDHAQLEHGAYVVGGGNYLKRFINSTKFAAHKIDPSNSVVRAERVKELEIITFNAANNEIVIDGRYEWLFKKGSVFLFQPQSSVYLELTVSSSLDTGGYTVVQVEDTNLDDVAFYSDPYDVIEINSTTKNVIVPCDLSGIVSLGDSIEVISSTQGNDGTYQVNQVTFDFALNRTDIRVVESFPANEGATGVQIRVPVFGGDRTERVIGAVYNPNPQEIPYDDYVVEDFVPETDATYIIPNNAVDTSVRKIDLEYKSPIRVETEYALWDDADVDATNNRFILNQSGQKIDYDYSTSPPVGTEQDHVYGMDHQIVPGSIFRIKFLSGFYGCAGGGAGTDTVGDNNSYFVTKEVVAGGSPLVTTIDVETDYTKLPPYGSFTINSMTLSNPGIGGQLVLEGNQMFVLEGLSTNRMFINEPIVSADAASNHFEISNFYYDDVNNATVIDATEEFISSYTGTVEFVDYAFIPGVFYDENNPADQKLWNSGYLVWEGLHIDDNFVDDDKLAKALISENVAFAWSGEPQPFKLRIQSIDPERNLIIPREETDVIQPGEKIEVIRTENNDGEFTVVESSTIDNTTFIKVLETLAYGEIPVEEVIDSFNVKVEGMMRGKLKKGDFAVIQNRNYQINKIKYTKPYSVITFNRELPAGVQMLRYREKRGKVTNKTS